MQHSSNNKLFTIITTGYEGNASELVILDKIDGYTGTEIGEKAFGVGICGVWSVKGTGTVYLLHMN